MRNLGMPGFLIFSSDENRNSIPITNTNNMFISTFRLTMAYFIFIFFLVLSSCVSNKNNSSGNQASLEDTLATQKPNATAMGEPRIKKSLVQLETVTPTSQLSEFYNNRNYRLAWFNGDTLNDAAHQLFRLIENSWKEGLASENYHTMEIYELVSSLNGLQNSEVDLPQLYNRIDIHITDAYFSYASDLLRGRVNPDKLEKIWQTHPKIKDLGKILEQAYKNNNIAATFQEIKPTRDDYKKLKEELLHLYEVEKKGGWPSPGNFSLTEEGDTGTQVIKIKAYLRATGDLTASNLVYFQSAEFDEKLTRAVEDFQVRHGIKPDGLVGGNTLKQMNIPVEYRIKQTKVNMERLRWLPQNMGNQYMIVNIPDYSMRYVKDNQLVMQQKIVVGELENYSPILKDTLEYIVFNPRWNIPYSIASEEMLPKIKADHSYLNRNNYLLLSGSYVSEAEVNPADVDWTQIDKDNFPYYIVQESGNTNALGRVKFMFPNHHSIYLHDTPADHLFDQTARDFSHGCIRLEEPFRLADELLKNQLNPIEIDEILAEEETQTILVDDDVVVHFTYITAFVDDRGKMNFRPDLYNLDAETILLLEERNMGGSKILKESVSR